MASAGYSNTQRWPLATGLARLWTRRRDGRRAQDTGDRRRRHRCRRQPGRLRRPRRLAGDADLAARQLAGRRQRPRHVRRRARGRLRAASTPALPQRAPIVSIDVADDKGMAMTSDVIARGRLDPREQGPPRTSGSPTSPSTPRSRARSPTTRCKGGRAALALRRRRRGGRRQLRRQRSASGVRYAPANDPFVITVGASDIGSTADDRGRRRGALVGLRLHARRLREARARSPRAATSSRLSRPAPRSHVERPGSIVKPGYMRLSGTSFAAPLVAGAAAALLALHPDLDARIRSRAR